MSAAPAPVPAWNRLAFDVIAPALGIPVKNVADVWPAVQGAFARLGVPMTDNLAVASLATLRVECPPFYPRKEYGTPEYFVRMYWDNPRVRAMLGNRSAEDAVAFCGRGLVQITGRWNYQHFGREIGVDLLADPDRALELDLAARLFAVYFRERHDVAAANAGHWVAVRKLVNGGANDLAGFLAYVQKLQAALAATPAPAPAGVTIQ